MGRYSIVIALIKVIHTSYWIHPLQMELRQFGRRAARFQSTGSLSQLISSKLQLFAFLAPFREAAVDCVMVVTQFSLGERVTETGRLLGGDIYNRTDTGSKRQKNIACVIAAVS